MDVGGVAGGMKYSVKGQFFKFAVDQGLYGDDCFAAKAAGAWACVRVFVVCRQLCVTIAGSRRRAVRVSRLRVW